ncbi:MAG: tetratricopeptide repeat protein, partial [Planctomycetales bacterium]|nr:tetratricopeptide repeat protein [Planctomycetales bacterium]
EMQLQVIDSLGESRRSLSAADQDRLLHLQAAAFARAGRTVDAIKLYEQLVEAHPDNGEVRERFAGLLLDSTDAKLLERALEQWRIVAARSRPDTDRWWSAKYHVALAQFKTGDKSGAAKLIRYLQATKGLGDAASAARFANLLKRCE